MLARARVRTARHVTALGPRRPTGRDAGRDRPLAVVYGNCTAEPLRCLLADSLAFSEAYRTEPIPAVHEIASHDTVARVRQTMAEARLVIYQPIRDDYRGMPVGSDQITAAAPPDARRLTFPALFYDGIFPYQAYVRATDNSRDEIPHLAGYHDLRFVFCAAQGWSGEQAREWLRTFGGAPDGLRAWARHAQQRLAAYESRLDIRVTDRLFSAGLHHRSFFTVDHPTNGSLVEIAGRIHAALGLPYDAAPPAHPLVGSYQAPLDADVIAALDLPTRPGTGWTVMDRAVPREQLLAEHLEHYARQPDSVAAAVEEHDERMRVLGLEL